MAWEQRRRKQAQPFIAALQVEGASLTDVWSDADPDGAAVIFVELSNGSFFTVRDDVVSVYCPGAPRPGGERFPTEDESSPGKVVDYIATNGH